MMLFSTVWAYRTSIKSSTRFTPFHLVYGIEVILSIECKILYLKILIELLPNTSAKEECIFYFMQLDETLCDVSIVIET
jgi:hypothetical protein